ncbi:hypothetical protein [Chlorogloea sp. CCALA 695]|uniref:hypothetical protein n=1 Tax=Chlorogloea sp. CCALA 695 TaxID=2107693 RepID=UPI000D07FA62|nr:hypothetical protein [Chlorogloea sp. CCALA 695]PSB31274.1 hypothetical protein C7B70_13930 [Chlorogloea sp. CCALA 695]
MNWKITLSFVLAVTLLTISVGWLTMTGVLPIQQNIQYSNTEGNFIRVWLGLAIALGLIIPTIAWLRWFKNPQDRKILGFYLFVLLVQIITEQVSSSTGAPSLVVTIGTVYTVFRLWQLWQGQKLIHKAAVNLSSPKLMSSLLWLLGLFWCSNLFMLLTLGWSSILN